MFDHVIPINYTFSLYFDHPAIADDVCSSTLNLLFSILQMAKKNSCILYTSLSWVEIGEENKN